MLIVAVYTPQRDPVRKCSGIFEIAAEGTGGLILRVIPATPVA